ELVHSAPTELVEELVEELFGGGIDDPHRRIALEHAIADGMKKVRLSQTRSAVDEEGVVDPAGLVGHGHGRRGCELIGGTHDEGLEGEALGKARATPR